jgi:hypothetical protein
LKDLTEYDGSTNPRYWRKKAERLAKAYQWNAEYLQMAVMRALKGRAEAAVQEQCQKGEVGIEEVWRILRIKFEKFKTEEEWIVELDRCRQGQDQSVEDYQLEINSLAQKAYPEDPDDEVMRHALRSFRKGLWDPQIKVELAKKKPLTLTEAVRRARRLELAFQSAGLRRMPSRIYQTESEKTERVKKSAPESQPKRVGFAAEERLEQGRNPNQGRWHRDESPPRRGYLVDDWRSKQSPSEIGRFNSQPTDQAQWKNQEGRRDTPRCAACGGAGHYANVCPSERDMKASPQDYRNPNRQSNSNELHPKGHGYLNQEGPNQVSMSQRGPRVEYF